VEALSFVHIPKTGGWSVGECIFGRRVNHARASELTGWRFAFVRHPFERVRSAFNWHKCGQLGWSSDCRGLVGADLSAWVIEQGERLRSLSMFEPMTHWLDAPMSFVGRYEHLAEGVRYVQRCCGLPETELPHMNASIHRDELTPAACRVVRWVYSDDFARFAYQ
jgi:hypothetical protein